jgi:hypothetical protein
VPLRDIVSLVFAIPATCCCSRSEYLQVRVLHCPPFSLFLFKRLAALHSSSLATVIQLCPVLCPPSRAIAGRPVLIRSLGELSGWYVTSDFVTFQASIPLRCSPPSR